MGEMKCWESPRKVPREERGGRGKIWESEWRGAPKLMRLSVEGKREAGFLTPHYSLFNLISSPLLLFLFALIPQQSDAASSFHLRQKALTSRNGEPNFSFFSLFFLVSPTLKPLPSPYLSGDILEKGGRIFFCLAYLSRLGNSHSSPRCLCSGCVYTAAANVHLPLFPGRKKK